MEIRDPVHGVMKFNSAERKVINSRPYQRLRAIKQLGFSEFSFPGATHNRFLHSLGVCHLSDIAFDRIFKSKKDFSFISHSSKVRLKQCVRLAALLHDVGHGPLSHVIEEVMPMLEELDILVYKKLYSDRKDLRPHGVMDRRANHEDYTIKFITDSSLSEVLREAFSSIAPIHVACLLNQSLNCPDDFFVEGGLNLRPLLSQIVSSEIDVDRMDYLERDAYFCGTNYGKVDVNWLLSNMTFHLVDDQMYLALSRRALYTFDDFLLARHHMHLMVYCHHKSIIYEEMLYRYLTSKNCGFQLPGDIEKYIEFTDYNFYQHIENTNNPWAKRIACKNPYKMLIEWHFIEESSRMKKLKSMMESNGFHVIMASSRTRLSKYHAMNLIKDKLHLPIYVVDPYDPYSSPGLIEQSSEIFKKYQEVRRIDRLYVPLEDFDRASQLVSKKGSIKEWTSPKKMSDF